MALMLLRHRGVVKKILATVLFLCVNGLILSMTLWTPDKYGDNAYYRAVNHTDEHQAESIRLPIGKGMKIRTLQQAATKNKFGGMLPSKEELNITTTKITAAHVQTQSKSKQAIIKSSPSSTHNFVNNAVNVNISKRLHERANYTQHQCKINHQLSQKLQALQDNLKQKTPIFIDDQLKLAQCLVAKAGCTYWGRIFSFLTRPKKMKSQKIHTPGEIDRVWLHHVNGFRGKVIRNNETQFFFNKNHKPLQFLFTRDPFKRLWSAYLDKYFLPGFWVIDPIGHRADLCRAKNVSFQTFLEPAVKSDDQHVLPISLGCNPCGAFKPDIIGEMDTFTSDTEFILQRANYSHLLVDYDGKSYMEREITSLSGYNFYFWKNNNLSNSSSGGCGLQLKELSRRLWKVFQYNGYIRASSEFPEGRPYYFPMATTQMFLAEANARPVMSKKESREQKHKFLVDAYRTVSKDVIESIQARFEEDFALFRYDRNPPT